MNTVFSMEGFFAALGFFGGFILARKFFDKEGYCLVAIVAILLGFAVGVAWVIDGMPFGGWNPVSVGVCGLVVGVTLGLVWKFFREWRGRNFADWAMPASVSLTIGLVMLVVIPLVATGREAISPVVEFLLLFCTFMLFLFGTACLFFVVSVSNSGRWSG